MPRPVTHKPRILEVPEAEQHLPREQRTHPYRLLPNESPQRDRVFADALASVEGLIHKCVVDNMSRHELRYRADWRESIVGEIKAHLTLYSLQRFDQTRGVRFSTFVAVCARNYARGRLSRLRKQSKRTPFQLLDDGPQPAPDQLFDRPIERAAAAIIANPGRFGFTHAESRLIQALANRDAQVTFQQVAKQLGYARQSSISVLLRKIRERISRMDIMDFDSMNGEAIPLPAYHLDETVDCTLDPKPEMATAA